MISFRLLATGIGRLALGMAVNGPLEANDSATAEPRRAGTRGIVPITVGLYTGIVGGWLVERGELMSQGLDKDARAMVMLKDILIAGSAITIAASLLGKPPKEEETTGPNLANHAEMTGPSITAWRPARGKRFPLVHHLNRVFVAGAVAVTPFINFALFNDYRPNPVRKFFSL